MLVSSSKVTPQSIPYCSSSPSNTNVDTQCLPRKKSYKVAALSGCYGLSTEGSNTEGSYTEVSSTEGSVQLQLQIVRWYIKNRKSQAKYIKPVNVNNIYGTPLCELYAHWILFYYSGILYVYLDQDTST